MFAKISMRGTTAMIKKDPSRKMVTANFERIKSTIPDNASVKRKSLVALAVKTNFFFGSLMFLTAKNFV